MTTQWHSVLICLQFLARVYVNRYVSTRASICQELRLQGVEDVSVKWDDASRTWQLSFSKVNSCPDSEVGVGKKRKDSDSNAF
jgi:hypothetical protein